jgi:hypothetical protein
MLISMGVFAQNKLDTLLKTKTDYRPTAVRVGTDVISLVRNFTDNSFSGFEVNGDIDFDRYYLVAEIGRWERTLATDLEQYSNRGNYFRLGADVNFLKKDPEKNMLFFGLRYGHGTFSESISIESEDPVWGTSTNRYSNEGIKANWAELTTGLKVKMFGNFWMGYTARFKFALNTNAPRGFIPHDVPGYGKTYNDNTWGFNYYVMFRIPVRKEKTLVEKLTSEK